MKPPKVMSLGFALPEFSYSQEEAFAELGYPHHFWRIFDLKNSGIEKRYFCLPLSELKKLSFQEQQETYQKAAIALSLKAIENCLDGRSVEDIKLLTFASCTGFAPGPTIAHYLLKELAFSPDTVIANIGSQGCEGALPGLRTAHDFVLAHRKVALCVNCELCSLTYFPEEGKPDPTNHWQLLRSNSIFADGCSAGLIGFDEDPKHPEILAFKSYTNLEHLQDLGYSWVNGRLRVILAREVPRWASETIKVAVTQLLARNSLKVSDIDYWVIHAAGTQVLDYVAKALALDNDKLHFSRQTLRRFGNMSSATVGVTGKILIGKVKPKEGQYLVMANVGPGLTSNAVLLRFPTKEAH